VIGIFSGMALKILAKSFWGADPATGVDQSRGVAEAYQVNRRVRGRGQPRAAHLPDILRNLHLSPIGALHLKHVHYIGLLHRNASQLKEDETHDLEGLL
jgi:hypothetical protein